jgi:chromate transporter
MTPTERRARLAELAAVFLKLGTIGFGGPAAHVALMEDEVVRRRRWVSRERFLDLVGATNLIPGPNSTELAIHLGRERAGAAGLLLAGACFIVPAFVAVLAIAWAYARWGSLPAAAGLLLGVKPVVLAVIAQALWGLGRSAARTLPLALIGVVSAAASAAGIHELAVLGGAALLALAIAAPRAPQGGRAAALVALPEGIAAIFGGATGVAATPSAGGLFLVFAKIGAVIFGSGYVLLAFLRTELVARLGWLSEAQLLDAVAVGQVTPGPVFTTATFVGYQLAGAPGACAATAGIFLPAFLFVALTAPWVERLRASRATAALLDGVNVASLGLMAVVALQLAHAALTGPVTVALATTAAILLFRFRVNSAWLVAGGAVAGLLLG